MRLPPPDANVGQLFEHVALQRLRDAVRRIELDVRGRRPVGVSHEHADDVVGSFATDSALGFDPFPLLGALGGHGAHAVVMGQVAGIMHGSSELTGDLDLLWRGHEDQAPDLAEAFTSVDAILSDEEGLRLPCDARSFHLRKVLFEHRLPAAIAARPHCRGVSSTSRGSSTAPAP